MRTFRTAAVLLFLALAGGCAFVRPRATVPSIASPSPSVGYVGGLFVKHSMVGFGFVVRDEKTQQEYVLEVKGKNVEKFNVIELPAGRYRVASWVTWALTTARLTRADVPASLYLARPFDVAAGQVILLGSWSADSEIGWGRNTYTVEPKSMTETEMVEAFKAAYPRFTDATVGCLVCGP